jgi:hypothetical protein
MGEITKKKNNILFAFWILSSFLSLPAFVEEEPFAKELNVLNKFCGLDVPNEQILANPCDIAISSEGFIYILDSEDNNLKMFKRDGTFSKCIGRKGQGPGEFVRPWAISVIKDKFWVADAGNRRVQVFSIDGMYLRSYKVPVEYGVGLAFDEKGSIYLNTKGFRSPKLISVHDYQGNLLKKFGNLEGDLIEFYDFTLIKKQIMEGKIPNSFKNDILLITDKIGNLFAVHRALNKFKKFSPKGKLLFEKDIKADEYKNIHNSFLQKNASEENPGMFWALYYVNDLAIDKNDNLYILLNEPSRMIICVYSSEGIFLGKLLGVEDSIFRIVISNDNCLYGLSQETHFIYKFKLPDSF